MVSPPPRSYAGGGLQQKPPPLSTRFTKQFSANPIVLAPMGGCAGGALAAAVSVAGGVGLVGSGGESLAYLRHEWSIATGEGTAHDREHLGFGINIAQLRDDHPTGTLESLLAELRPRHVYLSFGDCAPYAAAVRASGAALYSNCGDSAAAVRHARAGVTCIVCQGSDAGGHTSPSASAFALLPQARDALDAAGFDDALLLAAGGVCDGRGVAAALALGADAVVLGTALTVAEESAYTPKQKKAVVGTACGAAGTTIGTFIDSVRGIDDHPSSLPGRCVSNRSTRLEEEWKERDAANNQAVRTQIMQVHASGVLADGGDGAEWGATWAGAACGLVSDVEPAAEIIHRILLEARRALQAGASLICQPNDDSYVHV